VTHDEKMSEMNIDVAKRLWYNSNT